MDVKILKEIIIASAPSPFSPTQCSCFLCTKIEQDVVGWRWKQKKSFIEILIGLLSQFFRMTFIFHPSTEKQRQQRCRMTRRRATHRPRSTEYTK